MLGLNFGDFSSGVLGPKKSPPPPRLELRLTPMSYIHVFKVSSNNYRRGPVWEWVCLVLILVLIRGTRLPNLGLFLVSLSKLFGHTKSTKRYPKKYHFWLSDFQSVACIIGALQGSKDLEPGVKLCVKMTLLLPETRNSVCNSDESILWLKSQFCYHIKKKSCLKNLS